MKCVAMDKDGNYLTRDDQPETCIKAVQRGLAILMTPKYSTPSQRLRTQQPKMAIWSLVFTRCALW